MQTEKNRESLGSASVRYNVVRRDGKQTTIWLEGFVERALAEKYADESNRFASWMKDAAIYEVREATK